ncbi:hypothetical protein THRCLA_11342 [Thraustotheca clavata]|uniref:Uncharacterized protein n=1 Tax=Thraustotheca clavata TaxID=74557 RepID=A0A1V9Y807_9STRA|nr:hypothetical protein THRCLA_11342 [Thraustotheca clavata]
MFNGGNIMCGNDVPFEPAFAGILSGFGSASVCHAEFLEILKISTIEALVCDIHAILHLWTLHGICSLDICAGISCALDFNVTLHFLEQYNETFLPLHNLTHTATKLVRALDIKVIQYCTALNDTATTHLCQMNLLEPSEPLWAYYGWALIYEWVTGVRKVVQFQGDSGSITSITMTPDPTKIARKFCCYILWLYITCNMDSCICLLIVGNVWAGRTFLIIRSITAMRVLNTAPLNLVLDGHTSYIASPLLLWYKTIIASSEVTWYVYVLNDVLSIISKQYTIAYASKSSLSTWLFITI